MEFIPCGAMIGRPPVTNVPHIDDRHGCRREGAVLDTDLEEARDYFARQLAFTTGPVELAAMLRRGEPVTLIDVRSAADFAHGHLPGAINLPEGWWHTLARTHDRARVVVYCHDATCRLAAAAAYEFAGSGIPARELIGGFAAWQAHELPVVRDAPRDDVSRLIAPRGIRGSFLQIQGLLRRLPMSPIDRSRAGATLLRISLGVMFLAHSVLLKLLTFTLPGTAQYFQSIGLPPLLAYVVFAAEAIGGVLLVLGIRTRIVALALVPILAGATRVHAGNGWVFTSTGGGWEYPLFLLVVAVVVALLDERSPATQAALSPAPSP
jgi:putative oxidoreductase